MKRIILIAVTLLAVTSFNASAWDLKEALKGLGGADSTKTTSSSGSGLGSILGSILSTDKIALKQIQGVWAYKAPAVTFKSDNILKKAGGAAASAAIIEKLTPIYQRTGFDKAQLTINSDSTFTLKANKLTLNGTISDAVNSEDSQANFVFNFTVAGKMNIGRVDTYITKSATGNMSVMFDVSKLITIMETVSKFTSNSTITTAVNLLKSYDGLCAGFEMTKTADTK